MHNPGHRHHFQSKWPQSYNIVKKENFKSPFWGHLRGGVTVQERVHTAIQDRLRVPEREIQAPAVGVRRSEYEIVRM